MIGVSAGLEQELRSKFTQDEIDRFFAPQGHLGELRLQYDRGNGDLTSPLPSSRHMYYAQKGWTAVVLYSEPAPEHREPIDIPPVIAEHARNDRIGVWKRRDDQIVSSCRNAFSLLGKGFQFVGLANPERLRAEAEKRKNAADLPLILSEVTKRASADAVSSQEPS
jgi:hypothetical protein